MTAPRYRVSAETIAGLERLGIDPDDDHHTIARRLQARGDFALRDRMLAELAEADRLEAEIQAFEQRFA